MAQIKNFLFKTKVRLITFLMIVTIFIYFLFGKDYRFVHVDGDSMVPTYTHGESVVYEMDFPIERNSVVIIKETPWETLIKRVVGLEGDVINIKHGKIILNNKIYKDKYTNQNITYWIESEEVRNKKPKEEWLFLNADISIGKIPKDHVWVIGDNRHMSWYGTISKKNIKGVVIW